MNEKMLYFALLAQLEREKTVSIPQAAKLFNVKEDDIYKVLEALVFCYDNINIYLDLKGNYATLITNETSRLLRLNKQETCILLDALEGINLADSDLAWSLLQAKGFLSQGEDMPSPQIRTSVHSETGSLTADLACACDDEEHHLLVIEHQKEGDSKPAERLIEPYGISSRGSLRYLQAYCRTRGGFRIFRIDRIRSMRRCEETFTPRPDAAKAFDKKKKGENATILFKAGASNPEWPGLKLKESNADGSWTGSIKWLGGMWLPKQIVGRLGSAIPLEPPELVDETRNYATSLKEAAASN